MYDGTVSATLDSFLHLLIFRLVQLDKMIHCTDSSSGTIHYPIVHLTTTLEYLKVALTILRSVCVLFDDDEHDQ